MSTLEKNASSRCFETKSSIVHGVERFGGMWQNFPRSMRARTRNVSLRHRSCVKHLVGAKYLTSIVQGNDVIMKDTTYGYTWQDSLLHQVKQVLEELSKKHTLSKPLHRSMMLRSLTCNRQRLRGQYDLHCWHHYATLFL
jgi:hypothetical protein